MEHQIVYGIIFVGFILLVYAVWKWPDQMKSTKSPLGAKFPQGQHLVGATIATSATNASQVGASMPRAAGGTNIINPPTAPQSGKSTPAPFDNSSAPPYPKEEKVKLPDVDPAKGWLCLKASVKGFEKEVLQDAHAVRLQDDAAILVVADGQSRKSHSKAGADLSVAMVADRLATLAAAGGMTPASWAKEARGAFMAAKDALAEQAEAQEIALTEFACTLIALVATEQGVFCAHVGDGRAGYLDADAVFRPLLDPYKDKDGEANATVFLSMLTPENVDKFLRCKSVPVRSRCVIALSDGPETVCWHTATQDKAGQGKIEDPNMPAGGFFEKIAVQLVGACEKNVSQAELDKLWEAFLTAGNPALKAEKDDKTLVLALRG